MDNTDIKHELLLSGIIQPDDTLYLRFKRRLNQQSELVNEILWHTSFLEENTDIKVRLYCIIKNISQQPRCTTCDKLLKMRMDGKYRYTFATTCGSKCFSNTDDIKNRRRSTNLKKYGNTNYLASERGMAKSEQSLMDRYGVTNAAHVPGVREKRDNTLIKKHGSLDAANKKSRKKYNETVKERYGVDYVMQVPGIRKKQQKTCMDRYGVTNVWFLDDIQQKRFDTMMQRYGVKYAVQHSELSTKQKETMMQRYGVKHALQSDDFKTAQENTMMQRYGVKHALQSDKLKNKAVDACKNTMNLKYGKHYQQVVISDNSFNLLNDVNWLIEQHHTKERTLTDIAIELDVSHSTVGLYFKKYGIQVLTLSISQGERNMLNIIQTLLPNVEIISNTKQVIPPQELDIYLPSLKLAFEYNGIYWHSEINGKNKKYHITKTEQCNSLGIRLIHVLENEWLLNQAITISRISSILGVSAAIHGRKCQIIELNTKLKSTFFNHNHIQGDCASSINYGLMYENELVAVMTFGKSRFSKKYQYELIRYANKLNCSVVGGASKLFKHFIKLNSPRSVITYSDKRWNTGNMYNKLDFKYIHTSEPNYKYFKQTDSMRLLSRQGFQKHKLEKKLEMFDPNLTEWENMQLNGYDRIWDCGNDVYEWLS